MDKINKKIESNYQLMSELYLKLSHHSQNTDEKEKINDIKEIAAYLKTYELILNEISEKKQYNNEEDVLKSLCNIESVFKTLLNLL